MTEIEIYKASVNDIYKRHLHFIYDIELIMVLKLAGIPEGIIEHANQRSSQIINAARQNGVSMEEFAMHSVLNGLHAIFEGKHLNPEKDSGAALVQIIQEIIVEGKNKGYFAKSVARQETNNNSSNLAQTIFIKSIAFLFILGGVCSFIFGHGPSIIVGPLFAIFGLYGLLKPFKH